ncbi:MAG TPA: hypothetical protein VGF56_14455 [Rhizomicrobium sp.]
MAVLSVADNAPSRRAISLLSSVKSLKRTTEGWLRPQLGKSDSAASLGQWLPAAVVIMAKTV